MTTLDSSQWMYATSADFYSHTVGQSLRLEDGDSGYLWRQAGSSGGDGKTWTFSAWVKRANLDAGNSYMGLLAAYQVSPYYNTYITFNTSSQTLEFGHGATVFRRTTQVFRDVAAWYHVVVALDTTQSTASDRVKIYINGEQITSFSSSSDPSLNSAYFVNADNQYHGVGTIFASGSANYFFDGYMAEVHLVGGSALTPISFGETKAGIWIPKDTGSLSFGTHGFRLKFQDSSSLGDDTSGNGNDLTTVNFAATDVVLDAPSSNFAVLNVLDNRGPATISEGSLKAVLPQNYNITSTFAPDTGKWYWEVCVTDTTNPYIGVQATGTAGSSATGYSQDAVAINRSGEIYFDAAWQSVRGTTATWSANDIIGVAYNADDDKIWWSRNGQWYTADAGTVSTLTSAQVAAGNNGYDLSSQVPDGVAFFGSSANNGEVIVNFGQDSSFAGTKTAQGNGGDGEDFFYSPPDGFKALAAFNLPDPAIDPAEDEEPADYFNTVLWSGDGSQTRSLTGVGFRPDWTWMKIRSGTTQDHQLYDVVRGAGGGKTLASNTTAVEGTANTVSDSDYGHLSSFDSDGFSVNDGAIATTGGYVNHVGRTYVAWNWLAGGSAASNTDGTITSSVSASTEAGFSVLTFTGNGSGSATVGTGLDRLDMVIVKSRDTSRNWWVAHKEISGNLQLDSTSSLITTAGTGGKLKDIPSLSDGALIEFVSGSSNVNNVNASSEDYVAYCFKEIDGYSKVGSYIPNQNADGTFIHLGFRPAFFLAKNASRTQEWAMHDNKRTAEYNPSNGTLYPNDSSSEYTGNDIDFLSNGVKLRNSGGALNYATGDLIIFIAIAEQPFKYSNAR